MGTSVDAVVIGADVAAFHDTDVAGVPAGAAVNLGSGTGSVAVLELGAGIAVSVGLMVHVASGGMFIISPPVPNDENAD